MGKIKVGVFDSGVGGLSVVNAIRKELPSLEIIYKNDKQHVPYGTKTIEEIYGYVKPIFGEFIKEGCRVIVIACNTVTTNLASRLRAEFDVPMVGIEPMVKPAAANTETGVITVCATPRTLSSDRYQWLKKEYAGDIKVLEPDCSDWTEMIESHDVDREKIAKTMEDSLDNNSDQIVLGCTHYHWIEDMIKSIVTDKAQVIQPERAVVAQLKRVLEQLS